MKKPFYVPKLNLEMTTGFTWNNKYDFLTGQHVHTPGVDYFPVSAVRIQVRKFYNGEVLKWKADFKIAHPTFL